jgi:hypothetical protein
MYGGQNRCRSCKLESNEINNTGRELFWRNRIRKLDMEAGMHMHHRIESPVARAYFKIFGRIDRMSKSRRTLAMVIEALPYSFKNELRLRAELLFCKPMSNSDHKKLHHKLDRRNK